MTDLLNSMAGSWWSWQVTMLWQTAILIGIIWGIDLCIRKWAHPQVRYVLWLLVLVKLLLPPTLTSPASVTDKIPGLTQKAMVSFNSPPAKGEYPEGGRGFVPPDSSRQNSGVSTEIPAEISTEAATERERIGDAEQVQANMSAIAEAAVQTETAITPDQSVAVVPPGGNSEPVVTASVVGLSWKTYAMLVWLGGIAMLSGWLWVRLSGLRREHLKDGSEFLLPERFYSQLEEVGQRLRLRRLPRVILTDKVACPAVFGLFRPVLLIPADKLKDMSARDVEHILLHELAHIKRGDLWVHAVGMTLQIVYWFNPLLWLTRRPIQNLRELCCDATVARLLKDKTYRYRETLLETARQLLAEPVDPGLGLLGLFENSNWLVTRLQWLEKNTWKNQKRRIAAIAILVALMTTCVLPMANRKKSEISSQKSEFVTVLDNGVTIELVGICECPSDGRRWWRPDGSWLDESRRPYMSYGGKDSSAGHKVYEAAFQVSGINSNDATISIPEIGMGSGTFQGGITGHSFRAKPETKEIDFEVKVASGPWHTDFEAVRHQNNRSWSKGTYGNAKGSVTFSTPHEKDSKAWMTLSHNIDVKVYNVNIVAVDKDGNERQSFRREGGGSDGYRQLTAGFDVPLEKIQKFRLQTRKYQWVDFKNVALRPESLADSQILQKMLKKAMSAIKVDFNKAKDCRLDIDKNEAELLDQCYRIVSNYFTAEPYFLESRDRQTIDIIKTDLEAILDQRDNFFYAEYMLADWHAKFGDKQLSRQYYDRAFKHAPVVLVQKFVDENGTPIVGYRVQKMEIECVHTAKNEAGYPAIYYTKLCFPYMKTDADGCLYLPVYETSYRRDCNSYFSLSNHKQIFGQVVGDVFYQSKSKATILPPIQITKKKESTNTEREMKNTNYTATLANGVTVELVGICEYPSGRKQWWRPDGSLFFLPDGLTVKDDKRIQTSDKVYEFLYRYEVKDVFPWSSDTYIKGSHQWTPMSVITSDGEPGGYMAERVHFKETPAKTTVRISVAAGPWQTETAIPRQSDMRVNLSDGWGKFEKAVEVDHGAGIRYIELRCEDSLLDKQHRLVAIDKKGKMYLGRRETQSIKTRKTVTRFQKLELSDIKEFQFQTRPYEEVIFENVALRPGEKTAGEAADPTLLLQKAMEYDLTMEPDSYMKPDGAFDQNLYESFVKNADQGLAEEYYLAYLKEIEEPYRRAYIYNKLGKLFIGGVRQEVTATGGVDQNKAVGYFAKVLEETPDAVNVVTLNARRGMLSDPRLSREEQFHGRMDYYQWLCSIDEKKIIESNPSVSEPSVDSMKELIAAQQETVAFGLVQNAVDLGRIAAQRDDRFGEIESEYLLELIKGFPGTDAAKEAKKQVDKLSNIHSLRPGGETEVEVLVGDAQLTNQQRRRAILQRRVEDVRRRFESGVAGIDKLHKAEIELLRCDVESAETPQRKIAFLKQIADIYRKQEERAKQQLAAGVLSQRQMDDITLTRLDIEKEIAGLQAGAVSESSAPSPQLSEVVSGVHKGMEFLAEIPEFRHFSLNMTKMQLQYFIKQRDIIADITQTEDGVAYHLLARNGENIIVMFKKAQFGKCSGIQRMKPIPEEFMAETVAKWKERTSSTLHPGEETVAEGSKGKGQSISDVETEAVGLLPPPGRGALEFDGVDDFLQVQASEILDFEGPFTIQMWIKPEFPEIASPYKVSNLLCKGGHIMPLQDENSDKQTHTYGFAVTVAPYEENRMQVDTVYGNGGGLYPNSQIFPQLPGWTHLALRFAPEHFDSAAKSDLIVGRKYLLPIGHHYKGQIGELRIWGRKLTHQEVQQYKARAVTGNEPGLVACWTFEENTGQRFEDLTGNRNDARLGTSFRPDSSDPAWVALDGKTVGGINRPAVQDEEETVKYGGGRGTKEDPYQIWTAEQMNQIGLNEGDWDKHFVLMQDIDLGKYQEEEFNIIGYYLLGNFNKPFTGVFDGKGHTISNFTYKTDTTNKRIGIFGLAGASNKKGVIFRNLILKNPHVEAPENKSETGSLVGTMVFGSITNCHAEDVNVTGRIIVGGLVGSYLGTISDCSVKGRIIGDTWVGGLAGVTYPESTTRHCFVDVTVKGRKTVGGLISENQGKLAQCYSNGSVVGTQEVGGLVGRCSSEGIIANCYTTCGVQGEDQIGGLFGTVYPKALVSNCYATGKVTGNRRIGGVIGYGYFGNEVVNCFWNIETSGLSSLSADKHVYKDCLGLTTAQMKQQATFTGWDFEIVWGNKENETLPYLRWQNDSFRHSEKTGKEIGTQH